MPILNRPSNERELERLREIFLKAETDIINEVGRLRSRGLVDYHAVAALERVQSILRKMENDCWEVCAQNGRASVLCPASRGQKTSGCS